MNFLDIQKDGKSQADMLNLLGELLRDQCGFGVGQHSGDTSGYIYIDDAMFTGQHVLNDLKRWVEKNAPQKALLHVIIIAVYWNAWKDHVEKRLARVINRSKKNIEVRYWCAQKMNKINWALWPIKSPRNKHWVKYQGSLQEQPWLRPSNEGLKSLCLVLKLGDDYLRENLRLLELVFGVFLRPQVKICVLLAFKIMDSASVQCRNVSELPEQCSTCAMVG